MANEILGALEFAGLLILGGLLCNWLSERPLLRRLNAKLFPEV